MDELDGLRTEMERLAEAIEDLEDEVDTEVVAGILRLLAHGHSASAIIEEYGLVDIGL